MNLSGRVRIAVFSSLVQGFPVNHPNSVMAGDADVHSGSNALTRGK
jgi:hypothetical protein